MIQVGRISKGSENVCCWRALSKRMAAVTYGLGYRSQKGAAKVRTEAQGFQVLIEWMQCWVDQVPSETLE